MTETSELESDGLTAGFTPGWCLLLRSKRSWIIPTHQKQTRVCSKSVNKLTVTTLAGLLMQLGNCIPMELRLLALIDTAEGVQYLHHQNIYSAWRY